MANKVYSQASDGLRRTEFFDADVEPTIPGAYECSTGSGYVFKRTWDGQHWISPVNGMVSSVRMPWRGIEPESVEVNVYSGTTRLSVYADKLARHVVVPSLTAESVAPGVLYN